MAGFRWRTLRWGVLAALFTLFAVAPAMAQVPRAKPGPAERAAPAAPEVSEPGETEAETLPAVGRINHADYRRVRHCTFAAVSPQVALTAAHCTRGVQPEAFHLLYGYRRMSWETEGDVADVRLSGRDLAVLCLKDEAPATLQIGPPAERGDRVHIVGYGQPRVHVQQMEDCTVEARSGEEILLDCAARQGASGGPVLDAAGRIVGVMSRTGVASSVASSVSPEVLRACRG